ncbi:hypothetical protein ACIA7S_28570 [Streptomyces sp. NPDC051643]|uniref:hypothetical protein n=1 Tax=Streptomyces sp. NPDC051643 TaxID=3365665 RepID=UPI0037AE55A6
MSSSERAPRRTALAYDIAADAHWSTAGATRLAGAVALPERMATRASAGTPYNLSVYDLALDQDRALDDYAHRHGRDVDIPVGRTALADYAARLAESSTEARDDYDGMRLEHNLRAAMTIGDAVEALGKLACPKCLCWSLVETRTPAGDWAAACGMRLCATAPGVLRVFTLAEIVRHHLDHHRDANAA